MNGLRVAQVICTDAFAGAERYVATLSRQLAQAGVRVAVVGGESSRMRAELGPGIDWAPGSSVVGAVHSLLRLRRVDIVHVHMTAAETVGVLTRPVLRAPLIATCHFAQQRGASRAGHVAARMIAPRLAAQLAISEFVQARVDGESVVVRPGVADVPDPIPDARQRNQVVLVAQRLEREKRTDLALDVWAASGLAGRGWRLDLAGSGVLVGELRAQADRLGVADSVRFLGASDQVDELYRRSAVLLAPRPDEPYGLSVVEAMAAGLPVVAARGGGHDETVGMAADPALFDAGEVPAAGRLLAGLALDPERRDAYGAELRKIQQSQLSLAHQAERTIEVYRSVLRR